MAFYPKVREQHIAVFGESGSGKTVLVSSFYGAMVDPSTFPPNPSFDVHADDTAVHNRLHRNWLCMRDDATTPLPTRFEATPYYFSVKFRSVDNAASKKRPFDNLRLVWHDYPGEWLEQDPTSEEESNRRVDTFRSLMRSDVALVLVDGQKLLDAAGEEERYLKSLFSNIRTNLLRLSDQLLENGKPLDEFPRIWITALSKADLFPDWSVEKFRDLMVKKAADEIAALESTIRDMVTVPDALSVGEDFVKLSSAKFDLSSTTPDPVAIKVSERVGINLVLPIVSMLPLQRRVQWSERMEIPRRVLEGLADGADTLAAVLIGETGAGLAVARLGESFGVASFGVKAAALVLRGAKLVGPELNKINEEAKEKQDFLRAALSQFRLDLDQGVEERLLIRSAR